ncbi:ribosomal protein L7/L12 [Streptomyces sp. NPDC101234]|uniref:ribosomal protein L7/L12 n=1 Tax=Streptomyces sp. NPDC101234 TaxID=3366138 RepID=UPI0037FE73D5
MEEPPFGVLLTTGGDRGLDLVQAVRTATRLSAWRSKQLLDAAPITLISETWFERAEQAARRLNELGAKAELACRWCERVMSPEDCPVDPGPCSSPYMSPDGCPASRPGGSA